MKKFQDLDLSNAFLFAATAQDPEICRMILKIVLEREIPEVRVHAEHTIFTNSDYRMVRLDVYGEDELDVQYNIEAQNQKQGNLAKRSRFHQAEMDVASLKPGDDTHRIFFNTKGTVETGVSKELIQFLKYMENSTDQFVAESTSPDIAKLHEKVKQVKKNPDLEGKYMTGADLLNWSHEEGKAEGKAEAVLAVLSVKFEVPEELQAEIMAQTDLEVLNRWIVLAAKADSLDAFQNAMS